VAAVDEGPHPIIFWLIVVGILWAIYAISRSGWAGKRRSEENRHSIECHLRDERIRELVEKVGRDEGRSEDEIDAEKEELARHEKDARPTGEQILVRMFDGILGMGFFAILFVGMIVTLVIMALAALRSCR
jgi:Flp pilus assembly protein TadB